ncbi:hypothetical protein LI328DRAFT_129190 [Trichoderma asperelloides]|nr:hypothetical protein LI328DRAFT_129190 [Trichoderma asperelloides]
MITYNCPEEHVSSIIVCFCLGPWASLFGSIPGYQMLCYAGINVTRFGFCTGIINWAHTAHVTHSKVVQPPHHRHHLSLPFHLSILFVSVGVGVTV